MVEYTTAAAEKGTIISSLSGSGQVSASNQVEVKSKVSGDIIYLAIQNGQEVQAGTILARIDSSETQKEVRDAQTALETAQLELEELLEPVDELDLLKAENNLAEAKQSKQKSEDDILEGYEDAFNDITDAFLDLPTVMINLEDVIYSEDISKDESFSQTFDNISVLKNSTDQDHLGKLNQLIKVVETSYQTARDKYDQNFDNYKSAGRYSEQEEIEALLEETIGTVRDISETIKNEIDLLNYYVDYHSQYDLSVYGQITQYQSSLSSYTSTINGHLSSLLSVERSLEDNRKSVLDAERSIKELEISLEDLKEGADSLDIRAKKITIQQKEDALIDAQQSLADHYAKAPFAGIVAEVDVEKGESVSVSSIIATMITDQKIAEISLNEVDAAKVKVGQKAIIEFDAIEDLSTSGQVAEIDTLGTVSQGVVTYNVKITFDTQDERVKSGMSMSASIIVEMSQNAVIVSNSAIKGEESQQYVEILENGSVRQQAIEVGISNDLSTEVLSGVNEGDHVIIGQSSVSSSSNQEKSSSENSEGPPEGMQMMRMMK